MERGSRKRSSSAGNEKMDRVCGRFGKNGRTLFDGPKPTVGFSANGRRRISLLTADVLPPPTFYRLEDVAVHL